MRVGLWEVGQCVDFNADGMITTSTRDDSTGYGEGSLPRLIEPFWVTFPHAIRLGDECITHTFTDTAGMADVRTTAIDKNGNVWIGSYSTVVHKAFTPNPLPSVSSRGNTRLTGTVVDPPGPFNCLNVNGRGSYGGVIDSNGSFGAQTAHGAVRSCAMIRAT
jgi:hypothetical protein